MTGGKAKASKKVGAAFSAWDGYIVGKNIELVPGKRIVQSWRTSEFAADDPDSTITLTSTPIEARSARSTLTHRERARWSDQLREGRLAGQLFRSR